MARHSQNVAHREIEDSQGALLDQKAPFKSENTARKALRMLAPMIAPKIEVSSQRLNQWKNGEEINFERQQEILIAAKEVFMADLNRLQEEIDRDLMAIYGKHAKDTF